MKVVVNLYRLVLGLTLMLSGFVKAVDPLGTQYKIDEYLGAVGLANLGAGWATLGASVTLSAVEFSLGTMLVFAIRQRLTSIATLIFMGVMTIVSIWLVIANPVSDCGCFGEAIHLTNGQTLLKNIVLWAAAGEVARRNTTIREFLSRRMQKLVVQCSVVFILAISAWGLYYLPLIDFRPYHVGANIREGMSIPPGQSPPKWETTFVMEKDGKQKEFTQEDYPVSDSTWTLIDTHSQIVEKGYEPPIQDFSLTSQETGEDITDTMIEYGGYTFLLVAPHLEQADDSHFGKINYIYDYAKEHGYPFYCLTASSDKGIEHWRDITGAEYPFCLSDATVLKTIIRSNPGLLLLKDGTILHKWSRHNLPTEEKLKAIIGK